MAPLRWAAKFAVWQPCSHSPGVERAHPVAHARPSDGRLPAGAARRLVRRCRHAATTAYAAAAVRGPDGERDGTVGDGGAGEVL